MATDQVHILSQSVTDERTKVAIRQLERLLSAALIRISDLEIGGSGGSITLPIAESDVTNLVSDLATLAAALASKAALSHTHSITDLTGGADGDVITKVAGIPTWAAPSSGTNVTTLGLSTAAIPAAVNLTTVGSLDWLYLANSTPVRPGSLANPTGFVRCKSTGPGWLWDSFIWMGEAVRAKANTYGTGCTFSASFDDDVIDAALSSANGQYVGSTTTTGELYMGFKFKVPICMTSRTLKFWMQMTSGTATITCRVEDGSVAPTSTTIVAASGVTSHKEVTIAAVTSRLPTELTVFVRQTANVDPTSSSIGLAAIAVA